MRRTDKPQNVNFIGWLGDSSDLWGKPRALGFLISQSKANFICPWLVILQEYLQPTSCSGEACLYSSLKESQPSLSTQKTYIVSEMLQFTSLIEGQVHTTPEKSLETQLYFYGFPYVYANRRHKTELLKNTFQTGGISKRSALRLGVGLISSRESGCLFSSQRLWEDGKHFENGAFRKRRGHSNHVFCLPEFSSNTNPKWLSFQISRL